LKAFFLDRDGILNEVVMRGSVVGSPRSLDELRPVADAVALVEGLKALGYLTFVVTNQPDVGRGLMSAEVLESMHRRLRGIFKLDGIASCCSGDDGDSRRKPNPGMLLELADEHKLDLSLSFFLGDGVKDVRAARRAGVTAMLLKRDNNLEHHGEADRAFASLMDVLEWIRGRDEQV
jgi:D-glycero-D-manno-heptose 1,7-bisphosphate phosphatase